MNLPAHENSAPAWTRAAFASRAMREEFLTQVRLWNNLEDLPEIWIEPLRDGRGVRFRCAAGQDRRGLGRLIMAYGGRVEVPPARLFPLAAHGSRLR